MVLHSPGQSIVTHPAESILRDPATSSSRRRSTAGHTHVDRPPLVEPTIPTNRWSETSRERDKRKKNCTQFSNRRASSILQQGKTSCGGDDRAFLGRPPSRRSLRVQKVRHVFRNLVCSIYKRLNNYGAGSLFKVTRCRLVSGDHSFLPSQRRQEIPPQGESPKRSGASHKRPPAAIAPRCRREH